MRWRLAALLLLASTWCTTTRADTGSFDVAELRDRSTLTPLVSWLRDEHGTRTLEQVRALADSGRFQAVTGPEPSFGFTQDVYWLTFSALTSHPEAQAWVLRITYPLLDDLTLYRVLPSGVVEQVQTGDMRPFRTRGRHSVDFTFEERSERAPTQYFLRAHTTGALRIPLSAWTHQALLASERERDVLASLFLGGLVALALYNFGVFLMSRQLEYLVHVAVLATQITLLMSFGGLLSALVLPEAPAVANRVMPVALAVCALLVAMFATVLLRAYPQLSREAATVRKAIVPATLLFAFTLLSPPWLALRVALAAVAILSALGAALLIVLEMKRVPDVRMHVRAWTCLLVAVPIQVATTTRLLPSTFVTEWAAHIGCLVQGVVITLALASQLSRISARLADNVRALQSALQRAERATHVKDEFMATMSHELRTPLNAIINVPLALLENFAQRPGALCNHCHEEFALDEGDVLTSRTQCPTCGEHTLYPSVVTEYVGNPAQAQHYLALAERCGKHLLQMVNGVLDFSKIAAGKFELQLSATDPMRLLHEASESMLDAAKQKGVQLVLDLPNDIGKLATLDALRVRQVLFNLLSNAIKFSPRGGTITVSAHERELDLEIIVADQGVGIAREHHERIFGSFEQVHSGDDRQYGGTGLGLSISRSLIRMHGGELWVESELGKGATFHLRVPREPPRVRMSLATGSYARTG